MQQPHIVFLWLPVIVSAVTAFIFGGIWYTPLFGKTWARLMGFNHDPENCKGANMTKPLVMQFIAVLITSYVLFYTLNVWRPSVWGVGADGSDTMHGFICGFYVWLGFYFPQQFTKIAWEKRPWQLFFINAGHDFLNLQLMSQIIAHWRA